MDNLLYFLNTNTSIKKVLLFIGANYSADALTYLLDNTRLDELVITGNISEPNIEKIFEQVKVNSNIRKFPIPAKFYFQKNIETVTEDFTFVFDYIDDPSDILKFANLKFNNLVGRMWESSFKSFSIWESYRKSCNEIYIETFRVNKPSEILKWNSKDDTGIELSVIFPMYNVAKYLDQCISSVIKSKGDYIEFLFVNDGSPDNSREVVLKWAEIDSRVKLIDKENGGCASARQVGLDAAKGRYVGFIDPDDYVANEMFKKLLSRAMEGGYEICYSGYNEFYETTKDIFSVPDCIEWPYFDGVQDKKQIQSLIAYCRVAIWRGIYKKELLDKNGIHFYTDLRRFDDLPFKVETFAVAKSVVTVPEYLYYYRLARPGQDVAVDDDRLYVHFDIFNHLNDFVLPKKSQELIDWLQLCKIQTHRYAIRKIRRKFRRQYLKRTRKDLDSTGSYVRTKRLLKEKLGPRCKLFYVALKLHLNLLAYILSK